MSVIFKSPLTLALNLMIVVGAIAIPNQTAGQGVESNNRMFVREWGLRTINADLAWNITTGSSAVTVAVLDSGIDYTHPNLYLNISINQEEIPATAWAKVTDVDGDGLITFWDLNHPSGINIGTEKIVDLNSNDYIDGGDLLRPVAEGGWANGLDDDANGFIDDLIGWDFVNNDNDPMDDNFHGTFVAGIIGAVSDNGEEMIGVNWKVSIMPVKLLDASLNLVSPFKPFLYAVDNGARISNHSYGFRGASQEEVQASLMLAAYAASKQHLAVALAGNQSSDNDVIPRYPASLDAPNIISVAATTRIDRLASFSNFGATSVDLGAPGWLTWSTMPVKSRPGPQDYFVRSGTSFAAPHVSGAAALILSVNADLTYAELKSLILDNVDPVEDLQGITRTGGRLNVFNAVLDALR